MYKFILSFLFISSPAFADPWTTADSYRETAYLVIDAVDWAQTRNMARSNWVTYSYKQDNDSIKKQYKNSIQELNPILGKQPSVNKVDSYFFLAMLVHAGIAYELPEDWRTGFQYVSIGCETGIVAHNYSIGVSAKF